MRIDVLTILPEAVDAFTSVSLIGKARRDGVLDLRVHDLRDAATDTHRTVDDSPFGGGAGMVLKPEPVFDTVDRVEPSRPIIYLTPAGRTFDQTEARRLADLGGFTLLCGRYEGIDQRVRDHLVDDELSIGDYVLAGGEVAAGVVIEAVGRLVPGVLGNAESIAEESFSDGLLEYPHYTRPADYRGWGVPEVLRSGDHQRVARWRRACSLRRTLDVRPDLIEASGGLTAADRKLLAEFDLDRPADQAGTGGPPAADRSTG
jgi:tRNA (guanine37-N1)-methyltransferase